MIALKLYLIDIYRIPQIDIQLNTLASRKQVLKKTGKDESDLKIDKLKGINTKLMSKMKELNGVLERTLEKANQKKLAKMGKEVHVIKTDANHQLRVKEGELKNTKSQIDKYQKDIGDMQKKLGQA